MPRGDQLTAAGDPTLMNSACGNCLLLILYRAMPLGEFALNACDLGSELTQVFEAAFHVGGDGRFLGGQVD